MAEARRKEAIRAIFSVEPDELGDSFMEYLDRILDARMRLMGLADDVAEIELSITGYTTQSRLNRSSEEYRDLSKDNDSYYEKMITLRLDELEGVEGTGAKSMKQLTTSIEGGSIPREMDRLRNGIMSVGQPLTTKQIAANTRMALTISVFATLIAALSIVLSVVL